MTMRRLADRVRGRLRTSGFRALAAEAGRRVYRAIAFGTQGAHVEVSNCCNLRCEYCVLDEGAVGDRVMSAETFARVLPFLRGATSVQLSGLAEPLMNKRLTGMIAEVRRVAPLARILICTNASLLTRDLCEKFVELGLANLDFSLDGTDPELVDGIRRGGSLERLVRNMRTLQEVKRERSVSHPEVAAAMVLQKRNVRMLPGVVSLAADLGATALSVNGLEPYRGDQVNEAVWADTSRVEGLKEAVADAGRLARERGVDLRFASFKPRPPGCRAVQRPVVLADGSVVPCSVLAYSRRSVLRVGDSGALEPFQGRTERVVFGNVNERSLRSIWKDAAYRAFRRSVTAGDFPAPCRYCLIKHGVICQGIAPGPALDAAGTLATLR